MGNIVRELLRPFTKRHKKRSFITGLGKGLPLRVLLYYKTDPFSDSRLVDSYQHTNNWEILEIVRLLNQFGCCVDIVDRDAKNFSPENKYDLFIGLGAGNSGRYYSRYAEALPKAVKIVYAAGPEPTLSNDLVLDQYRRFTDRTGVNTQPMRLTEEIDFKKISPFMDYVFCVGYPNSFSLNSYKKFNKPVLPIYPGTSPKIHFRADWLKTRKRKSFVCFAGNGFICKGVDIVTEAFLTMPELKLHICGPGNEPAFFEAYGKKIESSENITYEGFVEIGEKRFNELCAECSFSIFYSSSEGCATSMATTIRAGLVPIVNYETGIDAGNFGFWMKNFLDRIGDIKTVASAAADIKDSEYSDRVARTLKSSLNFTQSSFTRSFSEALWRVMDEEGMLTSALPSGIK